jgi:hypothetical protein
MQKSTFLGLFVLLAVAVGQAAADGRPHSWHRNCRALEDVCDQMQALALAFYSNLYANESLGPRFDFDEVDWQAVRRLITDDFSWEDYSAVRSSSMGSQLERALTVSVVGGVAVQFSSAGIYDDIKKFWRAFTRATEPFEQVGLAVQNWGTCDPFELRAVDQYLETFARRDGCEDKGVTSTSIFVTEFEYDCGELKIKKVSYWTSSNLFDLVRPKRYQD